MKYLADHVTFNEYACRCCKGLPPGLYDDISLGPELSSEYIMLFSGFDAIREKFGKAIRITSGYRCTERQLDLYRQGISSTPYSVHIFGLALDLDAKDEEEVREIVKIAKSLQDIYNFRIGWQRYLAKGQSFVHVDLGWLICPRFSDKLKEKSEW